MLSKLGWSFGGRGLFFLSALLTSGSNQLLDGQSLIRISVANPSAPVVVQGLSGWTNYNSQYLNDVALVAGPPPTTSYVLADLDGDGVLDLVSIYPYGGSGTVEVHADSGASNFRNSIMEDATAFSPSQVPGNAVYTMADVNGDGIPDLVLIYPNGGSGTVEVHAVAGSTSDATRFKTHILDVTSPFPSSQVPSNTVYSLTDVNNDGIPDLVLIYPNGGSGTVEVHAVAGTLSAGTTYRTHLFDVTSGFRLPWSRMVLFTA